jgi:hypothetical protein
LALGGTVEQTDSLTVPKPDVVLPRSEGDPGQPFAASDQSILDGQVVGDGARRLAIIEHHLVQAAGIALKPGDVLAAEDRGEVVEVVEGQALLGGEKRPGDQQGHGQEGDSAGHGGFLLKDVIRGQSPARYHASDGIARRELSPPPAVF